MTSLFELLNRIIIMLNLAIKKKKESGLQNEYSEINQDVEGYITATSGDISKRMYKPDGEPPTSLDDLRKNF